MKNKLFFGLFIIAVFAIILILIGGYYGFWAYICWQFIQPQSFLGFTGFFIAWTVTSYAFMFILKLFLNFLRRFIKPLDKLLSQFEKRAKRKKEQQYQHIEDDTPSQ
jgi:hypothetical protein